VLSQIRPPFDPRPVQSIYQPDSHSPTFLTEADFKGEDFAMLLA
jgi:hypothetical protein